MNAYFVISYSLFGVATFDALFGIILLRNNPRKSPLHYTIAAMAFVSAAWAIFAGFTYAYAGQGFQFLFFYRLCWIGWFTIPIAAQTIYYIRDRRSPFLLHAAYFLYVFWGVVFILNLTTPLVEGGAQNLLPFQDLTAPLERPLRLIGGVLIVWIMVEIFILLKKSTGIRREKLRYFFIGTLIFAGAGASLDGFWLAFSGNGFDPALGCYFSVPWLLLTYHAISRYRLFDVQLILSNSLILHILAVVLAIVHVIIFRLLQPISGDTGAIIASLVCILLILHFTPLRHVAESVINRIVLKGRHDHQRIITEAVRALATIGDPEELPRKIVSILRDALPSRNVLLFLPRTDGSDFINRSLGNEVRLEKELVHLLASTQSPVVREELELVDDGKEQSCVDAMKEVGAVVAVPLMFQEKLRGVIVLGEKEDAHAYLQGELELLETLAVQMAVAVENSRLYLEAVTDEFSGLYHQSYFRRRLQEEVAIARQQENSLSLLHIEVDPVSGLNNRYGRSWGRIIRDSGTVIRSFTTAKDVPARYEGADFALLLVGADVETALTTASAIRQRLESILFGRDCSFIVTIGIGDCSFPADSCNRDNLIDRAAAALLQAKQESSRICRIG